MRRTLLDAGFSSPQIAEMAFTISMGCFYNRVSTLIACPPEQKFERLANGPVGRLIGLAARLKRGFGLGGQKAAADTAFAAPAAPSRFAAVIETLDGLPAAAMMNRAIEGAFESPVLGRTTKALMFAVVARSLACPHCEAEATRLLLEDGLSEAEVASALSSLLSARLRDDESTLLAWTRETVSYENFDIQHKTRALAGRLKGPALLEAIGVASLANATVRMAMLLE
jgi:alkylhydroperoxidase family enzyme